MAETYIPPKYPYDDDRMRYDYDAHMYVLTENCVLTELGINLDLVLNPTGDANPSTLAERVLKRISGVVYRWVYQNAWSKDWLEYILATYPPLRETIKDMLKEQLLYTLNNGFVGDYSGVNVAKGQVMDINALRGKARISPETEELAMQTIRGLGYCLKYAGRMPCVPCECYRRGY